MQINLPKDVQSILEKITSQGFHIYLVGGAVRDAIMGKIIEDWDFATSATPKEIQALFPESFYDNLFGTVGIPGTNKDHSKPHEITTFRTEVDYKDFRRPSHVSWGKTIEKDLERRDFTINAIAIPFVKDKLDFDKIIDPFHGQKDIKAKTIKAVNNPFERFQEDALRMMRAIRFSAQLGFGIEEKTKQAIKENAILINKIAKERVRDELFKIIMSPSPISAINIMRETELLGHILPELEKTFGVDQVSPQRHHIYDVGTHLLMSLKACESPDVITRFATLIHDIGKPQTYKKQANNVTTFYNHEIVSAKIAKRIAERLNLSKKQSEKLIRLVRYHQFTVDEHQTDSALRRFIRNVTPEYLDDMLELRRADRLGSGSKETSWRTEDFKKRLVEVQKQPFTIRDLKITGFDVMKEKNIKPGPKIGLILKELYKEVVAKRLTNEKDALLARINNSKT